VFVSGVAFLVITLIGIRSWLARSISTSMKHSFAVGIGLFLAFIGLFETGIVQRDPAVPVKIGDLSKLPVQLALGGFFVISLLLCLRVRGAILLGIGLTAVAGYALGEGPKHGMKGIIDMPWSLDYDLGEIAFRLDVRGVLTWSFLPVLLTLFLSGFLDTLGTLIGVGAAGDMLDEKGDFPEVERPMTVDALASMFAGLIGTSTTGAFIESATGVREGARTGLAAITTAALFGVALFFIPVFAPVQQLKYASFPALIAVGVLMMGSVAKIDFADLTEGVPAFATIVMMVFTYNIANGLTAGLIIYPVLKAATGRWKDLNAGSVALGLVCLTYYVFGLPH
jgi:adenine/guanine/hypoxanthine permease